MTSSTWCLGSGEGCASSQSLISLADSRSGCAPDMLVITRRPLHTLRNVFNKYCVIGSRSGSSGTTMRSF